MSETWDEARLQQYIADGIEESLNLDYKESRSLGKNNDKTREITKDVSAMANSDGGILIYGIAEYKEADKKHKPEKLDPINRLDFSKEWLQQVIKNIRPNINGLVIHSVALSSGINDVAYVIEIPQSDTAHQATDRRYYKRFNFLAEAMEDYEVRDLLLRVSTQKNANSKYVFISYSHKDMEKVKRIAEDIKQQGIKVWLDENIELGTADWETAIRQAIEKASVVIYFGSNNARLSPYVKDELNLAERFAIKILPLWVEGDYWIDCIPLGKSMIQFIDLRTNYYDNIEILIKKLSEFTTSNPHHINISNLVDKLVKQHFGSNATLLKVIKTLHEQFAQDPAMFSDWLLNYNLHPDFIEILVNEDIIRFFDAEYYDDIVMTFDIGMECELTLLGKRVYDFLLNSSEANPI